MPSRCFFPLLALCLSGLFVFRAFGAEPTDDLNAPERTITQLISLESESFVAEKARLRVGHDGRIYLLSPGKESYLLSMLPDGGEKKGGSPGRGVTSTAQANGKGVIVLPKPHLARRILFLDQDINPLGEVGDFLGGNELGWDAPGQVEIGADGSVLALDQYRGEIRRILAEGRPMGREAARLPIGEEWMGETKGRRWGPGEFWEFRVDTPRERFVWLDRSGNLTSVDWKGEIVWKDESGLGPLNPGAFDLDQDGNIYILDPKDAAVKVLTPGGKPLREIFLGLDPEADRPDVLDMRLGDGRIYIRRAHDRELFRSYDLETGELLDIVEISHRVLQARFPGGVWTAGAEIPFTISYRAEEKAPAPQWRVWLRPWNGYGWTEAGWADGAVKLPADAAGLYHLRVNASVDGQSASEQVEALVAAAAGDGPTVSLYVPSRRSYWGRGEAIPFEAVLRGEGAASDGDGKLRLQLRNGDRVVWEEERELKAGAQKAEIPAGVTKFLQPGEYLLTAAGDGIRLAPQPIYLGPGHTEPNKFHLVSFADYGNIYPPTTLWDAADAAMRHVDFSLRQDLNLFVGRLGWPTVMKSLVWNPHEERRFEALRAQLEAMPGGPLPEMADVKPAVQQIFSAYSAFNIEQMAILLMMDFQLPFGTGRGSLTPEKFEEDVNFVMDEVEQYPAFRGWDWPANWWLRKRGETAFRDEAQKEEYNAAHERALADGEWDDLLGEIAAIRYDYFRDPIKLFNGFLKKRGGREMKTAASGPYRQPFVYPPHVFEDVDEVDAHFQAEQISPPMIWGHTAAYYNLPGKRVWGHPETRNEDGTGSYVISALFQQVMWGAEGTGYGGGGKIISFPPDVDDPRIGTIAINSVMRQFNETLALYGGWAAGLEDAGPIALLVSRRMIDTDNRFYRLGGPYFGHQMVAWQAASYAGMPAQVIYPEYAKDVDWKKFRAVLMVDQKVRPEDGYLQALAAAQQAGVPVFFDGSSHGDWGTGAKPLGFAFDPLEPLKHIFNNDYPHTAFTPYILAAADQLKEALEGVVAPIAQRSDPTVVLNERRAGKGRFFFAVNQRTPEVSPAKLWRVGVFIASRTPQVADITVDANGGVIYDVFTRRRVDGDTARMDFRYQPTGLLAVLPEAVAEVRIGAAGKATAGTPLPVKLEVLGESGRPLETEIPVYLSVRNGAGDLLEERFLSVSEKGGAIEIDLPSNLPEGGVRLSALDLIAGREGAVRIAVSGADSGSAANSGLPAWSRAGVPMDADPPALAEAVPAVSDRFGPRLRDVTLGRGGKVALFSALNYGDNVFAVDTATGRPLWTSRLGNWFSYQPGTVGGGFSAIGFDWSQPEGYFLYRMDDEGRSLGRFAVPGLPRRLAFWMGAFQAMDHGTFVATSPAGDWVATAGNLGLAVWTDEGKLLWNEDLRENRSAPYLFAPKASELWICDGMDIRAVDPSTGKTLWQKKFGDDGKVRMAVADATGNTVALATTWLGGNVLLVRDGKLDRRISGQVETIAISPQGDRLARTQEARLFVENLQNASSWNFQGDDILRYPAFSSDGRLFVSSALGTSLVFGPDGTILLQRDDGALSFATWLDGGDLLQGDVLGRVRRLDSNYEVLWRNRLQQPAGAGAPDIDREDTTPIARWDGWTNSEETALPPEPNLLADLNGTVTAWIDFGKRPLPPRKVRDADTDILGDGSTAPPAEPLFPWEDVAMVDSGWRGALYLEIVLPKKARVDAVTFHEDPSHPESWLRDVTLEYYDEAKDSWLPAGTFLSDSAVHTHRLEKPVVAGKWRLVASEVPDSGAWLAGNVRLGELVLHGEAVDKP